MEGLRTAVTMAIRLTMLIIGSSLMTLTTTPNNLTDGMESMMKPLKAFRVPVHEVAMIMSIALRFIPILLEETDKIMKAQIARGADFETGNIVRRAKALVPLLVPLFISAFRRAKYGLLQKLRQASVQLRLDGDSIVLDLPAVIIRAVIGHCGQGAGAAVGAPVHLRLPQGERPGHGHGGQVLPGRGSTVMVSFQTETSSLPGVRNRLKVTVIRSRKTIAFIPFTMNRNGTWESFTR